VECAADVGEGDVNDEKVEARQESRRRYDKDGRGPGSVTGLFGRHRYLTESWGRLVSDIPAF
jgi:hypothetical protein